MKAKTDAEFHGPDGRIVRQMFGEIAHRYDFLNHFLSASIDKRWRRLAAAKVAEHLSPSNAGICLDLGDSQGNTRNIECPPRDEFTLLPGDRFPRFARASFGTSCGMR